MSEQRVLLQINTVVNSGSTGRIAEEIGELAISKSWKSYIAYGRNDRPSKSNKIKIGNTIGTLWHVFLTRFFGLHGFGSYFATKRLVESIKEIKPNIIHLHNIHGYYLNIKVLFEYLSSVNIPVVWTLHDCWTITGHGAHFKKKYCRKGVTYWSAPKHEYPNVWFGMNSLSSFLTKKKLFTSLKNLTIVTVSDWLTDVIKDSFFKNSSVKTINNAVDIEVFYPQKDSSIKKKYGISSDFMMIGVASIWNKDKGLEDYIKFSNYLKGDEVLVLVGVTDRIIKELPSNIIGVKRTEDVNELSKLYSVADVVFNLSYKETFGLTSVEGYACGTPTIVYNATASPELVKEGTGYVVPTGDLKSLRNAVNKIKKKGSSYYAENCRKVAENFYDKTKRYEEYFSLYQKLLSK